MTAHTLSVTKLACKLALAVGTLLPMSLFAMEDVPFVPLYNLASLYGAVKNLAWKMRPDEKVLGWDMKIT